MGVYGLWKLIEPSGKPVPLDTLENKVLAVDVSIWLHQAIKGFQDSKGGAVPNAHLLGIYHRVCKLLYYKIKPVFVFDGGVPVLKKQTIVKRQQLKAKNLNQATSIQQKLISTLLKHSAVAKVLSERTRAELEQQSTSGLSQNSRMKEGNNIYTLPPSQLDSSSDTDDQVKSSEETDSSSPSKNWDLHTIDVKSANFKSLPSETRHEILTELKETRKQNSWGRLHELPTHSDEFSGFQMNRLLNRYSVQVSLEEVEKEMGGHSLSLKELEALLKDTGVITNSDVGKRIASDENQKILFIRNVQEALDMAKKIDEQNEDKLHELEKNSNSNSVFKIQNELEQNLQTAIELSLQDQPGSSKQTTDEDTLYFTSSDEDNDQAYNDGSQQLAASSVLSSAKNYMTEYSGLTPNEISNIICIGSQREKTTKGKRKKVLPIKIAIKEITTNSNAAGDNIQGDDEMEIQKAIEESIKNNVVAFNFENVITEKHIETVDGSTEKGSTTSLNINEEAIEVMSDDSNSSGFVEVDESSLKEVDTPALQVIVHKNEVLKDEDDLFKDIFDNKNKASNVELPSKHFNNTEGTNQPNASAMEIVVENNPDLQLKNNIFNATDNVQPEQSEKIDRNQIVNYKSIEDGHFEKTNSELQEMLNSVHNDKDTTLSRDQLEKLKHKMAQEKDSLYSERVTKERLAENISDQVCKDAQELLQLFGIPYIVAPMEAEAQCAFLEIIGLTDGSITDDSDIWLFGGKTVYKNFFNQNKYVLEYRSDNIEHHFRLSREQLILLAMLVGSDYTTGISGVGPVTALEILASFPVAKHITFSEISRSPQQILSGLVRFRNWYIDGRTAAPQKTSLRTKLKNCTISEGFPNFQILNAYLQPEVDNSKEAFSWAKPDDVALIDFAKLKFGWSNEKTEEILRPVLKRMADSKVQKSVKDYFQTKHKLIDRTKSEGKMSKRVKKAVDKLDGNVSDQLSDEELQILKESKAISKRKTNAIEKDVRAQIEQASTSKANKNKEPKQPRSSTKIRFERSSEPPIAKRKPNLHRIDVIYQKALAKNVLLQNKLKAIETFRKSKAGPGYVKKRKLVKKVLKNETDLSDNSDSN